MDDGGSSYQLRLTQPAERGPVAALPAAASRRPIVLVLGMHRSGTSLCSHILSMLGVDMTDRIAGPGHLSPARDNPRGHWERWEIVEFHDRILALFNRKYSGPLHDLPLPTAWWADPRVVEIRREIAAFLKQRMGEAYFGFKDPRAMRLMPVWHQIVSELNLAPRIVLCLRNPAEVARSLQLRDGLDPELGEYRWLVHMIEFFRYAGARDFCALQYETWFEQPRSNIEKLRSFLDLQWQQSEADLDLVLSDIIDPALRHDEAQQRDASLPLVRSLYRLATRAERDAEARGQISYMATQFAGFQQLQRPLRRAFESVAESAARLREVEVESAALRAAIGEGEAALQAAGAAEARLAEATAKLDAQRLQLAEMAARNEALARAEEEKSLLRAAIAEREAASRTAGERASVAEARLAAALLETASHRARLAETERERAELSVAMAAAREELTSARSAIVEREQVAASFQARLAELEGALSAAHDRARAAEAGLAEPHEPRPGGVAGRQNLRFAELEGENALLRRAVTRAEKEAARAAALRSECDSIREALAAARQVAQAAMQALAADARIDRVAPPRDEPIGWWRAMRRRFGLAGAA